MQDISFTDLLPIQQQAVDEAIKMMDFAYCPYSHFAVGAALYTSDAKIIGGSNFENAAYPACICAERSAIVRANAMGLRVFEGIAITGKGEHEEDSEIKASCGICRQVMYEISQISGKDLTIVLASPNKDKIVITSIKELLPLPFGPIDLGIDIGKYKE